MSDEQKVTTEANTETQVTATPETTEATPSFGDLLKEVRAGEPEGEAAPETPVAAAPAEVKASAPAEIPQVTPPVAPAVTPQAAVPDASAWETEKRGLLAALSAVRAEVRELKQGGGYETPEAQSAPDPGSIESEVQKLKNANLETSRYYAKQLHSDFDEVYTAFAEEVKARAAGGDHSLYQTAFTAELPYETAYQIGKNLLLAKKYGPEAISNPDVLRQKLEKEIAESHYARGMKDAEAKLTGIQRERDKQPTNIGSGTAPGSTEAEYRSPSIGELLSQVHKKGRANGHWNHNV